MYVYVGLQGVSSRVAGRGTHPLRGQYDGADSDHGQLSRGRERAISVCSRDPDCSMGMGMSMSMGICIALLVGADAHGWAAPRMTCEQPPTIMRLCHGECEHRADTAATTA